jgi:hypothetical protein
MRGALTVLYVAPAFMPAVKIAHTLQPGASIKASATFKTQTFSRGAHFSD